MRFLGKNSAKRELLDINYLFNILLNMNTEKMNEQTEKQS